ncbi:hypothetical protein Tco_0627529 [Tanacetum coccineum]|uniref:Uncharacterized protein n=1 Tax=Tanacetum coccineum TaxID=301880 RepID=A0ABQ4WMN1_9ASTR
MDLHDEIASRNGKSKVDSSSTKADEAMKEEKVLKPKKLSKKKKKQVFESSSSYEDENPFKNKKKHAKIVPYSLFSLIHDSQVDMKSILSDVEFSLMHNVFIDTLPARLARFVVRAFTGSSYEFKLDMGIIRVTLEKVYEILGVPLGGTSIFDLPVIPLDDPFIKMWFKKFHPKPLKDIHASNIAGKLVLAKTVNFMFKLNFLMLFANVIGTADTMKSDC